MCSEINSFDVTLTFVHSAEKKVWTLCFYGPALQGTIMVDMLVFQ